MRLDRSDVVTIIGFALLVSGVGMIHIPASLITAGISLIALGILGARSDARRGGH